MSERPVDLIPPQITFTADEPDDQEPNSSRTEELLTAVAVNIAEGKPPYSGVRLQTRGEVSWAIRQQHLDATHASANNRRGSGNAGWPKPVQPLSHETEARLSAISIVTGALGANGLGQTAEIHDVLRGGVFDEQDDDSTASTVRTDLSGAILTNVCLDHTRLPAVILTQVDLTGASLNGAIMERADLSGAKLAKAKLKGARLVGAKLDRANLIQADLRKADLRGATCQNAMLGLADLSGANLYRAVMHGADLRAARMDAGTVLFEAYIDSKTLVADLVWNGAALGRMEWTALSRLGDEMLIAQDKRNLPAAIRANRQLAIALREQGLNEEADRFGYRAQVLNRQSLRRRHKWLRYLGSSLLALVAGYGFRPLRSFLTYMLVVLGFAIAYFALAATGGHTMGWNEAVVVSLTAFHGRGFFATAFQPGDPQAALAAGEAVIGLLIEITFIATFTQRFFVR